METFCTVHTHYTQSSKTENDLIEEISSASSIAYNENIEEFVPLTDADSHISDENKEGHDIKKRRKDHYQKSKEVINRYDLPSDYSSEEDSIEEEMVSEDEEYMPNQEDPVDLFTASDFDDFDHETTSYTDVDYDNSWILLWIFKYQERFRLSEVDWSVSLALC